jgi:hypothetical protein
MTGGNKRAPVSQAIFITGLCQNECRFCFERDMNKTGYVRGAGDVIKAMDLIVARGGKSVDLLGGEPLLNPAFEKMAAAAADRGLRVNITTNGLALADRGFARRVLPLLASMVVSIHAGDTKSYRSVTGNSYGFARLKRALLSVRELCCPVRIMFNTTVTADSISGLDGVLGLIAPFTGARWDLTNPFPLGAGKAAYAEMVPRVPAVAGVLPSLADRAGKRGIAVRYSFFPSCAIGYRTALNNDLREPGQAGGYLVDRRLNPHHRGALTFRRVFGRRCKTCILAGSGCSGVAAPYLRAFGDGDLAPLGHKGDAK